MELLTWIALSLCAVAGTIIVQFVVRDLYAEGPGLAASLLRRATLQLPAYLRARYEEEWLAHLHECKSVLPKFGHAIQCLYCARHLGKFHQSHRITFTIQGSGAKRHIDLDVPTAAHVFRLIGRINKDHREWVERLPMFNGLDLEQIELADADPVQLRAFSGILEELIDKAGVSIDASSPGRPNYKTRT